MFDESFMKMHISTKSLLNFRNSIDNNLFNELEGLESLLKYVIHYGLSLHLF